MPCWLNFGGDPQRSLARPDIHLGLPTKSFWARGMGSYMEYPPSYCDGVLYVNTYAGNDLRDQRHNGKLIWQRHVGGLPAVDAGDRRAAAARQLDRRNGDRARPRERAGSSGSCASAGKIESSPVAIGNTAYFGVDRRPPLRRRRPQTGHVRWAYQTGGRINASPSVWGNRDLHPDLRGLDPLPQPAQRAQALDHVRAAATPSSYESFYASATTDGKTALHDLALRQGGRAVGDERARPLDAPARRLRLLDAVDRLRARLRRRLRRRAARVQRGDRARALARARRRADPRRVGRDRQARLLRDLETNTYAATASDGKVVWRIGWASTAPSSRRAATTTWR